MIEIIIIIAVVKMFAKKAESKHLNKYVWGTIGGLSYYVPILILSFGGILEEMFLNGTIPFSSETDAYIKAIAINIGAGVLCCVIAYQILRRLPTGEDPSSGDLLDAQ